MMIKSEPFETKNHHLGDHSHVARRGVVTHHECYSLLWDLENCYHWIQHVLLKVSFPRLFCVENPVLQEDLPSLPFLMFARAPENQVRLSGKRDHLVGGAARLHVGPICRSRGDLVHKFPGNHGRYSEAKIYRMSHTFRRIPRNYSHYQLQYSNGAADTVVDKAADMVVDGGFHSQNPGDQDEDGMEVDSGLHCTLESVHVKDRV